MTHKNSKKTERQTILNAVQHYSKEMVKTLMGFGMLCPTEKITKKKARQLNVPSALAVGGGLGF
jgi:hypothetical protein